MKMFLISDNIDTYTGYRLAGVEGVVVHDRNEVKAELDKAIANKEIAVVVITEKIADMCSDIIDEVKTSVSRPLIAEIPDRHGRSGKGDKISEYIREAIGIKI